ncbi:MAG TPA: polysaccharide deacetylase family protein [Polyangiaceae bacterium]|nr:polysaccharide deacetylase family protein [Polyangiaceae bacterium]
MCGLLVCVACDFSSSSEPATRTESQRLNAPVPWSESPPDQFLVAEVPQFVAVTFDDNFVSGLGDVKGGMTWVTDLLRDKTNPAGNGTSGTFDGTPVRTSFFFTSLYIETAADNRTAWQTAVTDGHEAADHTVHHSDGTEFSADDWQSEIGTCRDELASADIGIGVSANDVIGFRSPYLAYNPNLVPVLRQDSFVYDSSVESCWQDGEDGTNCAWPYTLDAGSPDADVVTQKFQRPELSTNPGFWELPIPSLIVPSDDLAAQYGITPGLRDRIPPDMPLPSFYEKTTGKIAGLDITLFVDAGLSAAEVLGVLKYNLDLHLMGNRSPLVFVSHSHVYADNYTAAANALSVTDRQSAIASFIDYALSKPEVRMRPLRDLVSWLEAPTALNGVRLPRPPVAGAGGAGGASAGGSAANGGAQAAGSGAASGTPSSVAAGQSPGGATSAAGPGSVNGQSSCRIGDAPSSGSGLLAATWAVALLFRRRKRARALVAFARGVRARILSA